MKGSAALPFLPSLPRVAPLVFASALAVSISACDSPTRPQSAPTSSTEGESAGTLSSSLDEDRQPRSEPAPRRLEVRRSYPPQALSGEVSGTVRAEPPCEGWTDASEPILVDHAEPGALSITIAPAPGDADATVGMRITLPDGEAWCGEAGLESSARYTSNQAPTGRFVIEPIVPDEGRGTTYLVTASPTNEPSTGITLTTEPVATAPEGPAPVRIDEGTFGGLRLVEGFGHATLAGSAGGPRDASEIASRCAGFVAESADHVLINEVEQVVRVAAQSRDDTTLVVRGPNGALWCDDDTVDHHPVVQQELPPGRYFVYVGTYEPQRAAGYELVVSR